MTKATLTVAMCAILLWTRTALGAPTPQQQCDYARITAWKKYVSCVEGVVAKDAKGVVFDEGAASAKCRHAYFKKWAGFQSKASLAGSSCIGNRFMDNSDGTVTDNLTGLVWEKKTSLDMTANPTDPHDADNSYTWSMGTPWAENGTAFSDFLVKVNGGGGFAGANGWRLPTLAELQTSVVDFPCKGGAFGPPKCICPSTPCVDPALDAANTQSSNYWSATSYVPNPGHAWHVRFGVGNAYNGNEAGGSYVRAVRGGL